MELIKNNEMAEILGMKPSAFAKGVRNGRFTIAGTDEKRQALFNPEEVVRQYEATRHIAETQNHAALMPPGLRGGRPKGSKNRTNGYDYSEGGADDSAKFLKAKLAKEAMNARLLELKYKVRIGELIEKSEVQKQGAELGTIMQGAIQSWASRLAPEFAAMKDADEHDFHERLKKESNSLIIEIRKYCGII